MEGDAPALLTIQRYLDQHGLRSTTVYGDSRTLVAIREAKVHSFIDVEKEDLFTYKSAWRRHCDISGKAKLQGQVMPWPANE